MTDHEIQILAIGFNLGVLFMLAVHFVGQARDDRRDRRAVEGARAQLAKREATDGWRATLHQREPA
ncbi:MAG TPA: hypothetical protein VFF37_07195 [Streptomyces sp.]|nr:hypothetical protein [Streptomyces sp.]